MNRSEIFKAISNERDRQEQKWGEQNHSDLKWLAILMEEVGEVAQTILQREEKNHPTKSCNKLAFKLRNEELEQVAAVCIAWMEKLARDGSGSDMWKEKNNG